MYLPALQYRDENRIIRTRLQDILQAEENRHLIRVLGIKRSEGVGEVRSIKEALEARRKFKWFNHRVKIRGHNKYGV